MNTFYKELVALVGEKFIQHGELITGIIVGMLLSLLYDKIVGYKKLVQSFENTIKSKDDHIQSLKVAIGEKLKILQVEKKDKSFFDNIKKYFSSKN